MWFSRLVWPASKSPKRITKNPCTKFGKFCLSLFRKWGIHLLVSCEPLWVTLRLDFYLRTSCQNELQKWQKPRIFENFSKYFSWHEVLLARESQNLLCKLTTSASRLAWLTNMSHQKVELKIFGFLWNFLKQNTFPKQLKYSKLFLCLINIWLSMYNTFNQVQLHKWIRHLLNKDMCDMGGYQKWDSL